MGKKSGMVLIAVMLVAEMLVFCPDVRSTVWMRLTTRFPSHPATEATPPAEVPLESDFSPVWILQAEPEGTPPPAPIPAPPQFTPQFPAPQQTAPKAEPSPRLIAC